MSADSRTYSRDLLCSLNDDRPPSRSTRKLLLYLHPWKPGWLRSSRPSSINDLARPTSMPEVKNVSTNGKVDNGSSQRSAVNSLSIGWLNVQSMFNVHCSMFNVTNKTMAVGELIDDRKFDIFVMSKTWHRASDDVSLRLACRPGYSVVEAARETGRGGGIAVTFRSGTFQFVCLKQ